MTAPDSSSNSTAALAAVRAVVLSDIGRKREENQDSFAIVECPGGKVFAVCDGMGGARGGAIASELVATVLRQELGETRLLNEEVLTAAIETANQTVFQKGAAEAGLLGMGTTCALLAFTPDGMLVANVGDSRAYRLRGSTMLQLTEDHTLVRELLRSGAITEDQAGDHPVSHMLTRSLGPGESIQVDCWPITDGPARGDRYLICSDGLYNMVAPEEFGGILRDVPLKEAATQLIALANERGGSDNITVILVEIGAEYPRGVEDYAESVATEQGTTPQDNLADQPQGAQETVGTEGSNSTKSDAAAAGKNAEATPPPPPGGESTTTVSQPSASQPRSSPAMWGGMFGVFLLGLFISWWIFGTTPRNHGNEIASAPQPSVELATNSPLQEVIVPNSPVREALSGSPATFHDAGIGSTTSSATAGTQPAAEIGPSTQQQMLLQRRATVQARIDSQQRMLEALTGGAAAASQTVAQGALDTIDARLTETKSAIDKSVRALALWQGRKARFAASDPINLATEVSVSVDSVRQQKARFEEATWQYLKAAEVLRYEPESANQEQTVSTLLERRNTEMRQLLTATREAIEAEIISLDRSIVELSAKRLALEQDADSVRSELAFYREALLDSAESQAVKARAVQEQLAALNAERATIDEAVASATP